ncbi:uncharacterized protein LOC134230232 [Saccostrea cucullata]|uniref:uncharacterized protein LOC134230232 n=1 Tax=Saccostrea cuccullata TaxID=36930 RepID=UPI002ED50C2A
MTPIPQLPQHPISVHQPPNNTQTQQQQNPNQQTLYPRQQHYPLQPINSQSSENVYHTQLLPYPPMHHSTPITDTPHRPYAIHPTRFNQMQEQPYQPVPTPVAQQPAYTSQSAPCPVAPQPAYSFQSAPGPVAPQPEYSSHSAPGPVAPQPTFSSQSAPGPVAPQPAPGPVAPQPAYSSKSSNRQAGKQSTEFSSLVEAIPGMPSAVSEGDEILENFLRNTDDAEEIQADEVTDDVDVNNYKAALEAKEKEVAELKRQLEALKEELATVKQNQAGSQTELRTQSDGLPRAGLVPKEIAERSSMIELMPNSGVFVYPRDLRIASKKTNGTSIARFLMSVFYTSKELIERGNVMGVNGKHGLDKQITKAILDYAVIKGKETESVIKCAMRSKMSALVSFEKKKSISVQK